MTIRKKTVISIVANPWMSVLPKRCSVEEPFGKRVLNVCEAFYLRYSVLYQEVDSLRKDGGDQ